MSKLSRLRGKNGERIKDLSEERQKEISNRMIEGIKKTSGLITNNIKKNIKYNAEKQVQPFKTNMLLEHIKKNQTPLWIGIAILIISLITMILTTISLFK